MRDLPSIILRGFSIDRITKVLRTLTFLYFLFLVPPDVIPSAFAQPSAGSPGSDGRVALLIGNANYPEANEALKHPIKDVRKLADELRRRGFEVLPIGENLTKDAMK